MAKVTVKFVVKANAKKAYVVGSTDNLGAWNPAKAVELKLEDGVFQAGFSTLVNIKILQI